MIAASCMVICGAAYTQSTGSPDIFTAANGVPVSGIVFSGNTVFSDADLTAAAGLNLPASITFEAAEAARRRISQHYLDVGFINSGAVLKESFYKDGVLTFTIIEGRLERIDISGNQRLRTSYIEKRIRAGAGEPLNLQRLQGSLLVLRESPILRQVNTELQPGSELGTAKAKVQISEANPWGLALEVRNDRPPSVGGELIEGQIYHLNLTGNGDSLVLRYGIAAERPDGFEQTKDDDWGLDYSLPLTAQETSLSLGYSRNSYAIVEEPFDTLNIESESEKFRIGIHHPLVRELTREFLVGLTLERQTSRSTLFGEPFSLSAGAVNGKSTVTTIRLEQQYTNRGINHSLALRSSFNFGIDALDATIEGQERDSRFWTWTGQAHFARKLFDSPVQMILRSSVQLTPDDLPALEQFTIGGVGTVRGYRENEMVRDMGVVGSVEFRLPVWQTKDGTSSLAISPFVDFGMGWNNETGTPDPDSISSAGLGISLRVSEHFSARLDWGVPFRALDYDNDDAQDYGIHFTIRLSAF
jgi:hemolysin activation/secretion protein